MTLTAKAGSIEADDTTAMSGDITLNAASNLRTRLLESTKGSVTSDALNGDINSGTTLAGMDVTFRALNGSIDALDTTAGRDLYFEAGKLLKIGKASAGGEMTLIGGTGFIADTLRSKKGNVRVTVRQGDLTIREVDAGIDALLNAPLGNISLQAVKAGRDIVANAGRNIGVGTGTAGRNFVLASTGGDIKVGQGESRKIDFSAPGEIDAGSQKVIQEIDLQGQRIRGTVQGGAGKVTGVVTGYRGGIAEDVQLTLSGVGGFALDKFWSNTAQVNNPVGTLTIEDARIMKRGTFANPLTLVLVDQLDRRIQNGDVQLFTDKAPFSMDIFANKVFTDAYIIYRSTKHDVLFRSGVNTSANTLTFDDRSFARLSNYNTGMDRYSAFYSQRNIAAMPSELSRFAESALEQQLAALETEEGAPAAGLPDGVPYRTTGVVRYKGYAVSSECGAEGGDQCSE